LALQRTEAGAGYDEVGRPQNNVGGTLIVRQLAAAFPSHLNSPAILYACCVNFKHRAIVSLSRSILGAHNHVIYLTRLPLVHAEIKLLLVELNDDTSLGFFKHTILDHHNRLIETLINSEVLQPDCVQGGAET
jgi:hypothetical protein